jgi:hypothetical protein
MFVMPSPRQHMNTSGCWRCIRGPQCSTAAGQPNQGLQNKGRNDQLGTASCWLPGICEIRYAGTGQVVVVQCQGQFPCSASILHAVTFSATQFDFPHTCANQVFTIFFYVLIVCSSPFGKTKLQRGPSPSGSCVLFISLWIFWTPCFIFNYSFLP